MSSVNSRCPKSSILRCCQLAKNAMILRRRLLIIKW
ncbi:Uncharacterised protein [Vibrio cholerae]|nr:Uncharacterised protein [Vibrio cholerae]